MLAELDFTSHRFLFGGLGACGDLRELWQYDGNQAWTVYGAQGPVFGTGAASTAADRAAAALVLAGLRRGEDAPAWPTARHGASVATESHGLVPLDERGAVIAPPPPPWLAA